MTAWWALLGIAGVLGGDIRPRARKPIEVDFPNAGVDSNYTFHFKPDTVLDVGMAVLITFPEAQYQKGLGIDNCQALFHPDLSLRCVLYGAMLWTGIDQQIPVLRDGFYSLTIIGVSNPVTAGTTGHLTVDVLKGSNSLDFNDLFGQVSITPPFALMSEPQVNCSKSCRTGENGVYSLTFTLPVAVPARSQFVLSVPPSFGARNESFCVSLDWPSIKCTRSESQIVLSEWTSASAANSSLTLKFPKIRNPLTSGFYGLFQLTVMSADSLTILARSTTSRGPLITPNIVHVDYLCPNAANPNCTTDYPRLIVDTLTVFHITGRTSNEIPAGGVLVVNFSKNFGDVDRDRCLLVSGLMLEAKKQFSTCEGGGADKSVFVRLNAECPKGQFSLQIRVSTPVANESGSVVVTTYSDAERTHVIDQTEAPVLIQLSACKKMQKMGVSWSDSLIAGMDVSFSVKFTPIDDFPKHTLGTLRFRMPIGFTASSASPLAISVCDRLSFNSSFTLPSPNLIEIPIYAALPNYCETVINATTSRIRIPPNIGEHPFELTLSDGAAFTQSYVEWVYIGPKRFLTGAVLPLSYEAGALSVYEVSFTPGIPVPRATLDDIVSGLVIVEFPVGAEAWAADLGSSLPDRSPISCRDKANIVSAIGKTLVCRLFHGSDSTPAKVYIENFSELKSDATVQLDIGGIRNPLAVGVQPQACVTSYLRHKGIVSPLNHGYYSIPATLPARVLEAVEFRSYISLSPNSLRTPGVLRVNISPGKTSAEDTVLMVEFPQGFAFADTGTTCKLHDRTKPCSGFTTAGLLIINISEKLDSDKEQMLAVRGVTNPKHVIPPSSLRVSVLSKHTLTDLFSFPDFPLLSPGNIAKPSITQDNPHVRNLDSTYIFLVTMDNPLYFGGQISLIFPEEFTLTTTKLECSVNGILIGEGGLSDFVVERNRIEITSLSAPEKSTLTIKISHVVNPSILGWTHEFAIQTYSESHLLVDSNEHIPPVKITLNDSKGGLKHLAVRLMPNNRNLESDVVLTFLPTATLPAGTHIHIYFPQREFPRLPTAPECRLSGGLTTLAKCSAEASVLSIVTDTAYVKGSRQKAIELTVQGVKAVDPGSVSERFSVKLSYYGMLIAESGESCENRTVKFEEEPKEWEVLSFDYSPKTPSENAVYRLTVKPVSNFAADCSLSIKFPPSFPRRVSRSLKCFSPEISLFENNAVECTESNRIVSLTNTKGWNSDTHSSITVAIYRVTNPPSVSPNGPIEVFSQCGDTILDYTSFWPANTTAIPQPMALLSLQSTNWERGMLTNITISANLFEPIADIPPHLTIVVSFPDEFQLDDSVLCRVQSVDLTPCEPVMSHVHIPVSIEVMKHTTFTVTIENVRNPWASYDIEYPGLSLYAPHTDSILAKTTTASSPQTPLKFTPPPHLLEINKNRQWVQNRGTQSEFIYATISTSAPHSIALTPDFSLPGVTLRPGLLHFSKGATQTRFQITIKSSAPLGNYTLYWALPPDATIPTYALPPFSLAIVSRPSDHILVRSVEEIVQGSSADDNSLLLERAPASELILSIAQIGIRNVSVLFTPSVIRFGPGESVKQFSITVGSETYGEVCEFRIEMRGEDAAAYVLPRSLFIFEVVAQGHSPPKLTSVQIANVTQTSAQYKASIEKPVSLYWMVAWLGVRIPTLFELQYRSFASNSPEPVKYYSNSPKELVSGRASDYTAEFTGLRAGTRYAVFLLMLDVRNTSLFTMHKFNFTTSPHFRSAYLTLEFNTEELTGEEKDALVSSAAGLLEVDRGRFAVMELKNLPKAAAGSFPLDLFSETRGEKLNSNFSFYHLLLQTDPYDAGHLSPCDHLTTLTQFATDLHSAFHSFSDFALDSPVEIPVSVPSWYSNPIIDVISSEGARIGYVQLAGAGIISLCVVANEDRATMASSFQIYSGLDGDNQPCFFKATYEADASRSTVLLNMLEGDTRYWVFFTAGNDLPGTPDLISDLHVKALTFRTLTYESERAGVNLLEGVRAAAWLLRLALFSTIV